MRHQGQVLLIDADDTLWEENLHYERAIAAFVRVVMPFGYPDEHVRRQLDLAERQNIGRRGYGAGSFSFTLEEVYLALAGQRAEVAQLHEIRRIARQLIEVPRRVYDGVVETLAYLAPRHRLLLFTKGSSHEQERKIRCSGLESFFEACEIVAEKNEAAYRALLARHQVVPAQVWMVGNSPRSDVNPALAAGMNAVFIPATHNWEFENEEIRPGAGELLVLPSFRDLQKYF